MQSQELPTSRLPISPQVLSAGLLQVGAILRMYRAKRRELKLESVQ